MHDRNGSTAGGRHSDHNRSIPAKVLLPSLSPRVEQLNHASSRWIDHGQIDRVDFCTETAELDGPLIGDHHRHQDPQQTDDRQRRYSGLLDVPHYGRQAEMMGMYEVREEADKDTPDKDEHVP